MSDSNGSSFSAGAFPDIGWDFVICSKEIFSPCQGGQEPMDTDSQLQQQDTGAAAPPNQANQRKVGVTGQQQQGAGRAPQAIRGVMGNQQQNRVCHI